MDGRIDAGPQPGEVLGDRYRIVKPIGEGGMGKVFLAEDLRLSGQRWAVKWVPRDAADPTQPEKEAAIMTSLQHPSLPRIVDYIHEAETGACSLVMDYIEGETLLQRSAAFEHRLPWTTVVHYAQQLCDLLDYLHTLDSPIVFRDMKPSNVIVGGDDRVRLIDFGIARTYKEGKAADTMHVGSVGFAAPELLANRQTDHRADLYSLGSLLYFLLSGGLYYNFVKRPIEEAADSIPPSLSAVLVSLLADTPEGRYPSAKAVKAALLRMDESREEEKVVGHRPVRGIGMPPRRQVVTVCGLFPKAGATFIAVSLAKLLSERQRVAYYEFPWATGDSFLRMLAITHGQLPSWQDGTVTWRLRTGEGTPEPTFEPAALYKLLFETKGEIVIIDVSAGADPDAVEALLHASDVVVAVAAPDPAGLRSCLAVDNWKRVNESVDRESICWVANRMPEALKLPEFYKLFSTKPLGKVPELRYDQSMNAKWNGRWIMDETEVRNLLREGMEGLLQRISPGFDSDRGLRAAAKRWLSIVCENVTITRL
jgi:hypothetical protein